LFDLNALAEATVGYSGAEIEQAVISAMYDAFNLDRDITTDDILKVAKQSIPLSMTMKEKIDMLRFWAGTRARPASSAEPPETGEEGWQEDDETEYLEDLTQEDTAKTQAGLTEAA